MTRLLALDASTWWASAALLEGGQEPPRLVAELGIQVEASHAARLLPVVELLLAAAGWPKNSVDAYAAVRGPGSFTGLRVALGLVRGMALVAERPCLGVGTLHAMAEAFGPAAADRVPLLDAGRGEVYGARFDAGGSPPVSVQPEWVGEPELALSGGLDAVIFGRGGVVHEARLREAGYKGPIGVAPTSIAAAAGRIALVRLAVDPAASDALTPLYVRPATAEARFR